MTGPDPLAEYFETAPRRPAGLAGREGLHGAVDAILDELRIPAVLDDDGDWRIETDVGPFLIVVDKVNGDLVVIQTIQNMEGRPLEEWAETMYVLLQLNVEAEGARFAGLKDGDTNLLILTARLDPDAVTRASLESTLHSCMRLSRTIDEIVSSGSAEAAIGGGDPEAASDEPPAPNWYPDPRGEERLRYWDGTRWTDHTAA